MTGIGDMQAAVAAEALALRRLSHYKASRHAVEYRAGKLDRLPDVPEFSEIERRYVELVRECMDHIPENPGAELAYLGLLESIIADALATLSDGMIARNDEDMVTALALVQTLHAAANKRELREACDEENEPPPPRLHLIN